MVNKEETFSKKIKYVRQENEKNFKTIDLLFENIRNPFFILFMVVHVIYIIVIIGLFSIDVDYVETFNRYINYVAQLFISFYLLFRFNPFREYKCSPNDSIVIFWSSLFLLLNLGVIKYIEDLLLKNPTINKTYTEAKDVYNKRVTQVSDYLKEKRQNVFDSEKNDSSNPEQKKSNNNEDKNSNEIKQSPQTAEMWSSSAVRSGGTLKDTSTVNMDLVSVDNTAINNPTNDLKYTVFIHPSQTA